MNMDGASGDNNKVEDQKSGENKKIFVGGIAYEVSNDDLTAHFNQFGEVTSAQVKYDRITGRSRGFAFVEFASADSCRKALNNREQNIAGKQVEVKPAKSRENKKVFVGGLPSDYSEDELRSHFEAYGRVEDIEWPFDKATKQRRNFAFVVFEEEEAANKASNQSKQTFGTRDCDVKKAVPQSRRYNMNVGAPGGGRGSWMGARGGGYAGANGWNGGGAAYNNWSAGAAAGMGRMAYGHAAGWGAAQHEWPTAYFYQQHQQQQQQHGAAAGYVGYQNGGRGGGYEYAPHQNGAGNQNQNGVARNGGGHGGPSNGAGGQRGGGGYGQQQAQQY